ncbi:MAG TPA: FHA domain-containing protein [Anaerolineae bacterium]
MSNTQPGRQGFLRRLNLLAVLGLLFALAGTTPPASAQGSNTYFITNVDSSKFPNISFTLRAIDASNHVIPDLTAANMPVFENGKTVPSKDVRVTPHTDGPLSIVYVVDLGSQSNYQNILDALRLSISRLVDGGTFVDGRDNVRLLVRENPGSGDRTSSKVGPTSKGRELVDFVASYNFPRSAGKTKGLKGIDDAISGMDKMVAEPGIKDAAILFFSRSIEDPIASVAATAAQNTASDAKAKYIIVHTVQTDPSLPDQQPLQLAAAGSEGKFVKLVTNAAGASMDDIYQMLAAQRTYYTVSYVSPSGASGSRSITVGTPEKQTTGRIGEYSVTVAPPLVTLTPQSTILRRTPIPGITGSQNPYSPLSIRATVNVAWTDNITRSVQKVEYSVNGVVKDTKSAADFSPGSTSVEVVADISDITKPGTNITTLTVRVVDALGAEASAQERITVEVVAPVVPTATPVPIVSADSPVVPIVAIVVVFLLLAILLVLLLTRRRAGTTAPVPTRNAPAASPALATLFVLQGPPNILNQQLRLTKNSTVLGRDAKCDLSFYAGQPSSVSSVHAVVEMTADGAFSIKDNGSTNGTQVNGEKLKVGVPVPLRDGDEITLGNTANRGVKLRFASGQGERWINNDRTQIRM